MMALYSFLLLVTLVISSPVWVWRMVRQGRYREGLAGRLGLVPRHLVSQPGQETVWLHAVSVGETLAAEGLVRALEISMPEARIVISTTTPTGQRVAQERYGADRVFYFPLDLALCIRPYLRALRPSLVVLMESELWPRLLTECERAGVPVAVVNARVSDRSFPRYMRLRRLWTPLLRTVSLLLAQSQQDADRWLRIGAPTRAVRVSGNLKYDVGAVEETPLVRLLRRYLSGDRPVLVAGSTHAGEEEMLLRCARGIEGATALQAQLILAPRHPQRALSVAELVTAAGMTPVLLTAWRLKPAMLLPQEVLIVDTVGELAALYGVATAAFVGGSLLPSGGHNPLEPARLGVPVVVGQHTENFREIAAGMVAAGILQRTNPDTLCVDLERALRSATPEWKARVDAFIQQHSGATERTVQALVALLPRQAGMRQ